MKTMIEMLRVIGELAIAIVIVLLLIRWIRRMWFEWIVRVKLNAKCPACGNHKGQLSIMEAQTDNQSPIEPFVQHHCQRCGAMWAEPTVLKGSKWYVPTTQQPSRKAVTQK